MGSLAEHDFHLHTVYSDGVLKPEDVVRRVAARGVRHLALTDHETVRGWEVLDRTAVPPGVTVHCGIELDCDYEGYEIHMLGLDFDPGEEKLRRYLAAVHEVRKQEYTRLIARINEVLGEEYLQVKHTFPTPDGTWMKPHVFHALGRHPKFQSVPEVERYPFFKDWLRQQGLRTEIPRISAHQAIRLIKDAGGKAVLAHPGYYWKHGLDLPSALRELKQAGLDGVEALYPYFQPRAPEFPTEEEAIRTVRAVLVSAREMGLEITRGSDVHLPEHLADRYPQLARQEAAVEGFVNRVGA